MRSALLLLGVLLLSGCSGLQSDGTSPTTTASMTTDADGNVVPVDNATVPIEKGEPVLVEETLDLTQPGSFDHAWDVKNGYRAFRVTVDVEGAQGAPVQANTGLGYRLTGGTPVQTAAQAEPSQTSVAAGSPGCRLCFDAGNKDPNLMAGAWTLHLEWGPSAASAEVRIEVLY